MINNSILYDSKILLIFLGKSNFLFLLEKVIYVFVLDIFIFDFDDILFVLIDNSK